MGTRRRRSDRALRTELRSPGRPPVARQEHRRRFWAFIAAGLSSEDAAMKVGVSQPVGFRWFRQAGGMAPSHLSPSSKPPSGRYLSFAEREEIALWRAQGLGAREVARRLGRAASTISRELRRNAATRGGALEYRATAAQWHAERAARRPKRAKLAANPALRTYVEGRLARAARAPGGGRGGRAGRALEGAAARATAEPALGHGLEPAADRPAPAARLSRRRGDADQPRGRLPGALRPGSRRAAPRADRLPAHRTGAAGAAGTHPWTGQALRHARDPDQPAPGGGGGPGGAGPPGGRPHPRAAEFRDRHPRRAHDAVHDTAPPASDGGPRRGTAREERAGAGRARRGGGARRDHAHDHEPAGAAAALADLGPGVGDGGAREAADRGGFADLLL